MQRNQLITVVLVIAIMSAWIFFFGPKPPEPGQQPAAETAANGTESPSEAAAPAESPASLSHPAATPVSPDAEAVMSSLPAAADANQPDDAITLENSEIRFEFTRVGARLKQAELHLGQEEVDLVPGWPELPDSEAVYPLGLRFADNYLGDALDTRRWDAVQSPDGNSVVFSITVDGARIEKEFTLDGETHVLDTTVRYTNTTSEPRLLGVDNKEAALALVWAPQVTSHDDTNRLVHQKILMHTPEEMVRFATTDVEPPVPGARYSERTAGADWAAIRSAYFVVAMQAGFENPDTWLVGDKHMVALGVGVPRVEVGAGETLAADYRVYIGPNQQEYLAEAWPGLTAAHEFFEMFAIMDTFAKVLLGMLNWLHNNVIANYGIAIIILTIGIRMLLFPLTWKSMMSMKKMQKLAPEMERLKEEYKDDQEEFQKKMMEFYRERGVNPLGGCLPMFLQMPVFIALYRMLGTAFELRGAPFAGWITDLSAPDRLIDFGTSIPVIFFEIHSLNVLPFLMGISMFLSTRFTPSAQTAMNNPQQKMMMNIMPVMFSVFCYNVASGLNLYILTSTLLGIAQNVFIQRLDIDVDVDKKPKSDSKTAAKPKHFYNAAQARKREIAKETRKDKRAKALTAKDKKDKRS
ncbi:MAG: membrane protein insertase YidC [Candidatus Hydrogenedens sp.]|nr:membrane protein insertase YidC [Candidatus Hydrogenedens sp.]